MTNINESTVSVVNSFHPDLKVIKEMIFDSSGFALTGSSLNRESTKYGACSFSLNGKKIHHRVSKITPTKIGQFVTIWKRNKNGITEPYDISDDLDFIMITTRCDDNLGQFIFPKSVLADHRIITRNNKGGKRGIRVYPPWDVVESSQAKKTQAWQSKYFLKVKKSKDHDLMIKLFIKLME